MKYTKGFGALGVIVAIVALVLVVGIAYKIGKSTNTPAPVNTIVEEQQQNTITTNNSSTTTVQLKAATFDGISFKYPSTLVFSSGTEETRPGAGTVPVAYLKQPGTNNVIQFGGYFGSATIGMGCQENGYGYKDGGNDDSAVTDVNIRCIPPSKGIGEFIFTSSKDANFIALLNQIVINPQVVSLSTTLPKYVGTHADCGSSSQCWPPTITTSSQSYSCNTIGVAPNTDGNDVTKQKVINGRTYCIHNLNDGYAGGRGYTYTYTTSNGNGTKIATLGLLLPSCGVYGISGTQPYDECHTNQTTFNSNLDALIDSLMWQ